MPHRKTNVHAPAGDGYDQQLRKDMLRWADGSPLDQAGITLLCQHGFWPEKLDRAGYVTKSGSFAVPEFRKALKDLTREGYADGDDQGPGPRLYASGSELAILRIAASLCSTGQVSLGSELAKLDKSNQRLVITAITNAWGPQ